ncbi:hypothetical protein [Dyella acidiphila]|uniref:Uncharacterized protein n=1 Tax=Dyella acidiphila TaxID=2775866 RepID=A0ABR9GER3_9GAMM|nr:hypothetical protein [Dyella acidiphila]MBE1162523.1 hypothetical protein [Dyella acidiphila]
MLGKLDLRPAYFAMFFMLAASFLSSMAYDRAGTSVILSKISAFGSQHIAGVREAARLPDAADSTAFVMTMQWLLVVIYPIVFFAFLSPFSKVVKVAIDKAVKREQALPEGDDKKQFVRVIVLVLGLVVLLGDLHLINIPTFLNGGLFVMGADSPQLLHALHSKLRMPAFAWLISFATFMFYWSWLHLVVNVKIVFNL